MSICIISDHLIQGRSQGGSKGSDEPPFQS